MLRHFRLPLTSLLLTLCTCLGLAAESHAQHKLGSANHRTAARPAAASVQSASAQLSSAEPATPPSEVTPASHGEVIGPAPGVIQGESCGCGGGCSSGNCGGDCGIGFRGGQACREPMFWVRAEALSWWLDGYETPALVTTSPDGTVRDDAAVLGLTSTRVLFGGDDFNNDASPGGRYSIGTWLNPQCDIGVELSLFHVNSNGTNFTANSSTAGIIGRPFFNVTDGEQDAELIVFPSVVTGSIRINSETKFNGGEVLLQHSLGGGITSNLTGMFGYRYQRLDDSLQFTQATTSIDAASPIEPGTTFDLVDNFRTENTFHGGELGLLAEIGRCNNLSLELLAKVAVGSTQSRVAINGSTRIVTPSGSDTTNEGALLALPSNSGTFEQDDFSVVPEIALRMNYQLACNWQVQFGYTFIYWSNVARVGDQIDPRLNLSQLPPGPQAGDNLPAFTLVNDDFWAQGLNLGLQYDF